MCISEKIAKKPMKFEIMNSHEEDSYGFTIKKQLEEDFKVYEYLHEHPNQRENMEQYITLLNSMLTSKQQKRRKKQYMHKITKWQLECSNAKKQKEPCKQYEFASNSKLADTYYSQEEFVKIRKELEGKQENTEELMQRQEEMNRILLTEVSEKKKSLNLMKGDIGHMIARYESIMVLQKKVNKVSDVTEHQLKHVSLSLLKDQKQVQMRQQLQQQFYDRLKSAKHLQRKKLKKCKLNYFDSMAKRKQIFERLKLAEKQCAAVAQYSDKIRQKKQKNSGSTERLRLLGFICEVIERAGQMAAQFESKLERYRYNLHSFSREINKIFCYRYWRGTRVGVSRSDEIESSKLGDMVNRIVDEYRRLEYEVAQKKKLYGLFMDEIEEQWVKISKGITSSRQLKQQLNLEERYQLEGDELVIKEYFNQLKILQKNHRVVFKLVELFSKKLENFGGLYFVTMLCRNQFYYVKIEKDEEQQECQIVDIFTEIQRNLPIWFSILKKVIKQKQMERQKKIEEFLSTPCTYKQDTFEKELDRSQITKKDNVEFPTLSQFEIGAGTRQQEEEVQNDDEEEISQNTVDKCQNNKKMDVGNQKIQQCKKVGKETVKRLQMMEKIDQTYYNMIKQTIKMEKENTKRNFNFLKNYKTHKFIPDDGLFEERRFQSTFWSQFNNRQPDERKKQSMNKFRLRVEQNNGNGETRTNKMKLSSMHSSVESLKNSELMRKSRGSSFRKNVIFWEREKRTKLDKMVQSVLGKA